MTLISYRNIEMEAGRDFPKARPRKPYEEKKRRNSSYKNQKLKSTQFLNIYQQILQLVR